MKDVFEGLKEALHYNHFLIAEPLLVMFKFYVLIFFIFCKLHIFY